MEMTATLEEVLMTVFCSCTVSISPAIATKDFSERLELRILFSNVFKNSTNLRRQPIRNQEQTQADSTVLTTAQHGTYDTFEGSLL